MELVLHKDFFVEYLSGLHRQIPAKSKIDNLRYNIVNEPDNIIILSENYVDLISNELYESNSDYWDEFNVLINQLTIGNRNANRLTPNPNKVSSQDEFIYLSQHTSSDFFISIVETQEAAVPFAADISQINTSNVHYALCNLASVRLASLEYLDFDTTNEIESFFNTIFSLPIHVNNIYYFDRYANHTNEHNCFNALCRKSYNVEVYTWGIDRGQILDPIRLRSLKTHIFACFQHPCKVAYTTDPELLHERRIFFNNLSIKLDNEFRWVTETNKAWSIELKYSPNDFITQYTAKCARFTTIV
jgi:hypothetical protein